jgi:hypothetical protein
LRNPADFEFEKSHSAYQTFIPNRNCIPYSGKNILHCSSIVRDVLRNGGEYEKLVAQQGSCRKQNLSKIGQSLIGDKKNKMSIERELNKRSGSKCELCGAAENLKVYELLPTKKRRTGSNNDLYYQKTK